MNEATNAVGLPAVELTDEQKYVFDTCGWLCIPGVLEADEVVEMRDFCYRLARDPDAIPNAERSSVGSHKAAFERPLCTDREDHPLWDTYDCPAGSVLFFTEAITHAGVVWKTTERERCAIFNCYNTIGSKWHTWEPPEAVFQSMPPKRRSLFRPVYCQNNTVNPGDQVHPGNAFFPCR